MWTSWVASGFEYEPYKVVDGIKSVVEAMRALRAGTVTGAELDAAREILLARGREEMATADGAARAYADAAIAGQTLERISTLPSRVRRLTKEDVVRVANRYFTEDAIRVVLLGRNEGLDTRPIGLGVSGTLDIGLE